MTDPKNIVLVYTASGAFPVDMKDKVVRDAVRKLHKHGLLATHEDLTAENFGKAEAARAANEKIARLTAKAIKLRAKVKALTVERVRLYGEVEG